MAFTATATTQNANEFWISTNTATADLGTITDPYDGSTEAKFDSRMANLPPNSTMHIMAGTYQTYGDEVYYLKSGQKILGSGIDVTIFQLVSGTASGTVGTAVLDSQAACNNIEISDLTCDCNYTSGSDTYHGIALDGTQNAIRRVKVVHQAYFGGNTESFGIVLENYHLPDNTFKNCEDGIYLGAITYGSI